MNKTNYIINQIRKSYKKKYENYVITRIWHLLNNLDIKFVTQQHVTRPTGRALTDMYFPQIQLHIEVDESHHYNKDGTQVDQDYFREADIINATGHAVKRIGIFAKCSNDGIESYAENSIENINEQIDVVVDFIQNEIKSKIESNALLIWDIEAEYNPKTYIDRGQISVDDNVAFRTISDACNCFGHNYLGFQRGLAKHAVEEKMLWFPKLYENEEWANEISPDETEIHEKKKFGHETYFNQAKHSPGNLKERVTFARVRSNLGDIMYRFKGVYKFDVSSSENAGVIIYKRTSKFVKTYKPVSHQSQ